VSTNLYCIKHGMEFTSFEEFGLPQAACTCCRIEELQAHVQHRIDDTKASIKRIKEAADGNDSRRDSKCISNDIPTRKATS